MKFFGGVERGPRNNILDFAGHPDLDPHADHDPDSGFLDPEPDPDSGIFKDLFSIAISIDSQG